MEGWKIKNAIKIERRMYELYKQGNEEEKEVEKEKKERNFITLHLNIHSVSRLCKQTHCD